MEDTQGLNVTNIPLITRCWYVIRLFVVCWPRYSGRCPVHFGEIAEIYSDRRTGRLVVDNDIIELLHLIDGRFRVPGVGFTGGDPVPQR